MKLPPWDGRCTGCARNKQDGATFGEKGRQCVRCRSAQRRQRERGKPRTPALPANDEPSFDIDVEDDVADTISAREDAPDRVADLVRLTKGKKGPMEFGALCDALDLSPAKTREVIAEARARGVAVRAEGGLVGVEMPAPDDRIREIDVAPVVGETQRIAVISDTHLGSKYCLRAQLRDFIEYAYSRGVRRIVHPGDILDGDYRHAKFEMSHMGVEEQTRDLFETLPQKDGLRYGAIGGNHDDTFTDANGIDTSKFIERYFKSKGRYDFVGLGSRGAFVRVGGAVVHLWHPRSGVSYARSYALQKHIEKYSSGEKPHILLAGHWHVYCHVYERGVHAFACPTFQGGGSAFGRSLGGAPAIGGMILEWDLTASGTMRNLRHEFRAYFEREQPHRIDDRDGGIPVERAG